MYMNAQVEFAQGVILGYIHGCKEDLWGRIKSSRLVYNCNYLGSVYIGGNLSHTNAFVKDSS